MVQQTKVVGDVGLSVAGAGTMCLERLKEVDVGAVVAREILARGKII